jgi:hypothetical protein
MRHALARVREKDPVPFRVAKYIYEKGSPPVGPFCLCAIPNFPALPVTLFHS